ncbi:hypothetical protein QE152_g8147 [Popillia japonica]|uniref:Uncharacterized protein n=1 Tax=Popillia japonica TaxID=7064 RepID=A0AAW1MDF6_POPJA
MALTCHCCNKNVIEIETVCCYVCNNLFSTSCVNLTDKDTRVLRSKKNIKWTCTTCCSVEVPNLIHNLTALVTSLQNDITELKAKLSSRPSDVNPNLTITELKSKLSSRPSDVNPNLTFTFEEVVHEVEERRRKEKNLVLFNLEDTESIEADKAAVLDLLQHNREIEAKNKIISDYRRRREHDNNIALRYVNGMPRIVSKN